jgi:hypothetical protein
MSEFRAIHKYKLPLAETPGRIVTMEMPKSAIIMKVAQQPKHPHDAESFFVWAYVDPDEKEMVRYPTFTCGTGHRIPKEAAENLSNAGGSMDMRIDPYHETLVIAGGMLVVHVFIGRIPAKCKCPPPPLPPAPDGTVHMRLGCGPGPCLLHPDAIDALAELGDKRP